MYQYYKQLVIAYTTCCREIVIIFQMSPWFWGFDIYVKFIIMLILANKEITGIEKKVFWNYKYFSI